MFSFEVNKTEIVMKEKEQMTSGSVKVYTVVFDFSSDWDGFYKTAIFKAGSTIRNVYLGFTSACTVPWEVLVMPNVKILIGVYGENNTGSVLPTVWTELGPVLLGVDAGDGVDPAPTPDSFQEAIAYKQDKLSGTPGQVVGFDEGGNAQSLTLVPKDSVKINQDGTNLIIGALVPGKNLLLNWDFRNPVNRQERVEYIGKGYTIDRWLNRTVEGRVKVEEECVSFSWNRANSNAFAEFYSQNDDASLAGKEVTYSILASGEGTIWLRSIDRNPTYTLCELTDSPKLFSCHDLNATAPFSFRIVASGTGTSLIGKIKIYAAKLELGDQQTLARQNSDGEWEIIDPSDYDLQYALCSLYSPTTGEWVGSQHSNPNLLDNAYWANPDAIIDQRNGHIVNSGVTYYSDAGLTAAVGTTTAARTAQRVNDTYGMITISGTTYYVKAGDAVRGYTGIGYTIDRWNMYYATLTIDNDGISLTTPADAPNSHLAYMFEQIPVGQTVTLSALVSEINGSCRMQSFGTTIDLKEGLNVLTRTIPIDYPHKIIYFLNYIKGSIKIKAAKLELGPVQTLAHQDASGNWVLNDPPPNKALELAKCQRYYESNIKVIEGYSGTVYDRVIPFKVTKRSNPACTVYSMRGTPNNISYLDTPTTWADHPASITLADPFGARVTSGHIPKAGATVGYTLTADANL